MKNRNKLRQGQVAIIVLLVSAVLMTVGLSLSKKATVETKIDTNDELLKKAFNAAESGIDYYLGTGQVNYNAPDNLSSAEITTKEIVAEGGSLDFKEFTPKNSTEFYWLVNHLGDGSLGNTYYSGSLSVCTHETFNGSLEINYFYFNGSNYGVKRFGYNLATSPRVNGFTDSIGNNCVPVAISDSPLLVTVTPIFNGGNFYLDGDGAFPVQGIEISSTGKAGGIADEATAVKVNKILKVNQRYKLPAFMLTGIVSETSVLSN